MIFSSDFIYGFQRNAISHSSRTTHFFSHFFIFRSLKKMHTSFFLRILRESGSRKKEFVNQINAKFREKANIFAIFCETLAYFFLNKSRIVSVSSFHEISRICLQNINEKFRESFSSLETLV